VKLLDLRLLVEEETKMNVFNNVMPGIMSCSLDGTIMFTFNINVEYGISKLEIV
jgi:hypothetical protein